MKFPSIFRTATPMRFDIKPRYYDPIREELEERTSRIKKELEDEGLMEEGDDEGRSKSYGGGIRGSFSQYRGIKPKNQNMFNSTATIRTLLFFAMITGVFGYMYIGPQILNYLLYGALVLGAFYYFFRFSKRGTKDD